MSHILDTLADRPAFTIPFPVTHSILAPEALLAEVLPLYDLAEQVSCLFLTRGVNDTYLVWVGETKYILRVYRAGWRSLSDVLYEIEFVRYLDQKEIAVSMPVFSEGWRFCQYAPGARGTTPGCVIHLCTGRGAGSPCCQGQLSAWSRDRSYA